MVTARLGLPCHLSNDANCAALAETVAGGAVGCRNMILITLGTGVGGGIVADGQLLEGVGGTGAEVGHTVLVLDGEDCTCGRKGCWEAYASATALIRQGKRAGSPRQICGGGLNGSARRRRSLSGRSRNCSALPQTLRIRSTRGLFPRSRNSAHLLPLGRLAPRLRLRD
jgi:predicted NBD/HSP70 family sugar kinase